MADRTARSKALEEKKRKLEELRARRARRETAPADAPRPSANLDEYIDGLLQQSAPAKQNEVEAQAQAQALVAEEAAATAAEGAPSSAGQTEASSGDSTAVIAVAAPTPQPKKPTVATFEFGTQTLDDDFPIDPEEDDEPALIDPTKPEGDVPEDSQEDENEALQHLEPKLLTNEEKEKTVGKVPFSSFLNTASKKVERILGEPVLADLLVNFVGETDGAADANAEAKSASALDGSKYVSAKQVFTHVKWTTGRNVTDLDWSPLHRELMLSAHDIVPSTGTTTASGGLLTAITPDVPPSSSLAPRSGELQADGLVLVWNLAMPSRPEHIFTCGSPVLAAKFHPTEAPLVIGGCQSGQLVIWDVRAGRLPVQRSGQGYPISAMEVTEGNSGLVTTSTDGKVSFWSLANLRDPVETIQLEGNFSCLATGKQSSIMCGDECGALFVVPAKRKQAKKLAAATSSHHFGMVTAVSTKKDLVLSSGVDWTVKLMKNEKEIWSVVSHTYDYMSDVQWNPVHPSLFATASSNGTVGLWNLAESTEEAQGEIVVEPPASGVGINKVRWSADGRRMLVASAERVHVLSLAGDVLRQKGDEEDRMMNRLI